MHRDLAASVDALLSNGFSSSGSSSKRIDTEKRSYQAKQQPQKQEMLVYFDKLRAAEMALTAGKNRENKLAAAAAVESVLEIALSFKR